MTGADALETRVRCTICQLCYLQPEELRLDLKLVDLGLDSLAMTSVVTEIEATYQCGVTPEQMLTLYEANDLGELIQRIRALVGARCAA